MYIITVVANFNQGHTKGGMAYFSAKGYIYEGQNSLIVSTVRRSMHSLFGHFCPYTEINEVENPLFLDGYKNAKSVRDYMVKHEVFEYALEGIASIMEARVVGADEYLQDAVFSKIKGEQRRPTWRVIQTKYQ